MNRHSITFGIPTYNGAKYIAEALESILLQAQDIPDFDLEILVADNASTDNTLLILHKYEELYPSRIRLIQHSINQGYDKNVDSLFEHASGEYVCLLGDDDMMVPGSLKKLTEVISRSNDYAAFLFSTSFMYLGTQELRWNSQFTSDFETQGSNQFFSKTRWMSAPLASLCLKRTAWLHVNREKYMGSHWIHVGGLLSILNQDQKAYIFAENMVTVRVGNPRWEKNFGNQLYSGLIHLQLFKELKGASDKKSAYQLLLKDRYSHNFHDLLAMKPPQLKAQLKIASLMITLFAAFPLFWVLHLPALFIPNKFIKLSIDCLRKAKRSLVAQK